MTVEELIEKLQHIHSNYIVTVHCGNMFDETDWDYLTELLHFENIAKAESHGNRVDVQTYNLQSFYYQYLQTIQ